MARQDYSYLSLGNLPEIERLHQLYLQDPQSVEPSWRYFFEGIGFAQSIKPATENNQADLRLFQLIEAYRKWGHLKVEVNPISLSAARDPAVLKPEHWGFKQEELSLQVPSFHFLKEEYCSLKELIEALENIYCRSIGIEYLHLENEELKNWIQTQFESNSAPIITNQEKIEIFHHLKRSELFETFLHTKYVGQKRFSLEGIETLTPLIFLLIEQGASFNLQEAVIGMSHRGRLNVLANILGKSYSQIFYEFEDHYQPTSGEGTGDVKYHKGFTGCLTTLSGKKIPVMLAANPSHLESVDPITEGIVRAKQEEKKGAQAVLPILIHGDAAVAGQGVVYETLQMGRLPGYETGGTIHIVVNNQIGFTTSSKDARSTRYCSDIAKAFNAPIFHVNAEDPIACALAAKLAAQIRQEFGCDVFIDLNGYRKYGHNEGDEPLFTQPLEYALIKAKESIYSLFCKELILQRVLTKEDVEKENLLFKEMLQKALQEIPSSPSIQEEKIYPPSPPLSTGVDKKRLKNLSALFCSTPEGFKIHPKVRHLQQTRLEMLENKIDWGMAEHLAFATLLEEKISIRLSGQDVGRGTFSHRHALIVDQVTAAPYFPLAHLSDSQGSFKAYNSFLSEYAVLGFDFGYSITKPADLVIWEAQFGDFANTAQVLIDQYIASSEQKWGISTRLTLMLPHGYEGQGPEHSSARMERFLQLCAQDNLRVVNASTPAQLFHVLREQGHFSIKKPLILFTPKALLRHPSCVSSLQDLTEGKFQEVIADETVLEPTRLLLCSGKIYYDLTAEREKLQALNTAIVRIEQLYPFPKERFLQLLSQYKQLKEISWAQEEPSNMGAWEFLRPQFNQILGGKEALCYSGREASASPAAGSYTQHKKQLKDLLEIAFKR